MTSNPFPSATRSSSRRAAVERLNSRVLDSPWAPSDWRAARVVTAGVASLDVVSRHRPTRWREAAGDDFVARGQGNPYFWYYGTLATFLAGGDSWNRWNESLKACLLPSQDPDGSWPIISPYAEYAADSDDDRVYTTALNVLMLEIYYRYLTPFQEAEVRERRAEPRPPTRR